MKRNMISLFTLASASTALILPAFSGTEPEKPVETIVELDASIQGKLYEAVNAQVLQYLNPKVPVSDRFSRVLRPLPAEYYASEIVKTADGGMIEFRIVRIDRMNFDQRKPTFIVAGQYDSASGGVFLMDSDTGKYVPAAGHSLIRKKPNT